MGLFNFVKDAGEKLWDAVTGQVNSKLIVQHIPASAA